MELSAPGRTLFKLLIFRIKETKDYVTVPGLGHVTFYRQPGRYPTLFHLSKARKFSLSFLIQRVLNDRTETHCRMSSIIKGF